MLNQAIQPIATLRLISSLEQESKRAIAMRIATLFACCVACMFLAGCGLVAKYTDYSDMKNPVYGATIYDTKFIYEVFWGTESGPMPTSDFWPLTPLAVVDLPIALVVDTVAIPFDMHQRNQKGQVDNSHY